jgi:GMP synthase (glutamine-hydrolysing)
MPPASRPFLVSGENERDVGQLRRALADIRFVERWRPTTVTFTPRAFAGLVILGDGADWATSRRYQRERDWLSTALESGTPVLGICYGAQLLAAYLDGIRNGRPLSRNPNQEHVGKLVGIELTDPGLRDPVVGHLAQGTPVAQWHEDSFQEPTGGTALAWSKGATTRHCEAFRVGAPDAAIYGLQFHPEPTEEMLVTDRWFKEPQAPDDIRSAATTGEGILRAWVALALARLQRASYEPS